MPWRVSCSMSYFPPHLLAQLCLPLVIVVNLPRDCRGRIIHPAVSHLINHQNDCKAGKVFRESQRMCVNLLFVRGVSACIGAYEDELHRCKSSGESLGERQACSGVHRRYFSLDWVPQWACPPPVCLLFVWMAPFCRRPDFPLPTYT